MQCTNTSEQENQEKQLPLSQHLERSGVTSSKLREPSGTTILSSRQLILVLCSHVPLYKLMFIAQCCNCLCMC